MYEYVTVDSTRVAEALALANGDSECIGPPPSVLALCDDVTDADAVVGAIVLEVEWEREDEIEASSAVRVEFCDDDHVRVSVCCCDGVGKALELEERDVPNVCVGLCDTYSGARPKIEMQGTSLAT